MEKNYIIISDLHLGYRAKNLSFEDYKSEVEKLDEHFNKFINYYTSLCPKTPWELIINGDFIDFIQINYRIEAKDSDNYKLSLDEIKYGMNNKEMHIIWKLRKIAKIHEKIFRDIAEFINKGNYFVLIKGNHDVEFYWSGVKKELKNILASFIDFKSNKEKENFLNRIKIKDWIYYKKDLFYIEHGNQYDEYTSFNHFVTPLDVMNHKKIEMPYSHISMRYWVNLTKNIETHDLSDWTLKDFFSWLKIEGIKGIIMHVFYYFRALYMVLNNVKFSSMFDPYLHLKERYYIKKIARLYNILPKILFRINGFKRIPVGNTVYDVLSAFYIDGFIIFLNTVLFLVYSAYAMSFMKILFAFIMTLMFSTLIHLIFSYDRKIEPCEKIKNTAYEISKILNAKYYIFAHTHHPEYEKLSKGKYYINSGSWILRSNKNIPKRFNYNLSHIVIKNGKADLNLWKIKYDKPIEINEYIKKGGKYDL